MPTRVGAPMYNLFCIRGVNASSAPFDTWQSGASEGHGERGSSRRVGAYLDIRRLLCVARKRCASSSRWKSEDAPSPGLAQRSRASAKHWRFVGAPRKATRFVSAEFQGRHARVAANYPLGRARERAEQRSRRTRFVLLRPTRGHRRAGAFFSLFSFLPELWRAAPGLRAPIRVARSRPRAPCESYTCPTR